MEAAVVEITLDLKPESVELEDIDAMPSDYKEILIRTMAMQAYAERLGAEELGKWIAKTSKYTDMRVIARICYDEANHAYWLYKELDALGVSMQQAIDMAEGRNGRAPSKHAFEGPQEVGSDSNEVLDVALNNMFLDRAGRFMVSNFSKSSYGPWARVCQRILHDEHLHQGFGLNQLRKAINSDIDRAVLSEKTSKWYALGLNFFGPPSEKYNEKLFRYGIKRKSNKSLREEFEKEVESIMAELDSSDLIQLQKDEFPYK